MSTFFFNLWMIDCCEVILISGSQKGSNRNKLVSASKQIKFGSNKTIEYSVKKEIIINELEELKQLASQIVAQLQNRRKVFFYGEVGAGKTTLIKEICSCLELKDEITSPSYPIINQYFWTYQDEECRLNHIDLYRLHDLEEALAIGIEDCLEDNSFCFVEWPSLIEPLAIDNLLKIKILHNGDSSRKILFL